MSVDPSRSAGERADGLLRVAAGAARWIRAAAAGDGGWLANPDAGGRSALAPGPASLYAGAPGIVLFFLELAAATGEEEYLRDARAGCRYLVSAWREVADVTFHHGLSGIAAALCEAGWVLGDGVAEEAAAAAMDRVARSARRLEGGAGWSGDPALRGDGGVVLALLRASAMLGVPAYAELAAEAGARAARLAVPGHRFGDCPGLPADAVTPGFLAGTAGTAYVLARLYGVTGQERFLAAARRGAAFVRAVSVVSGGSALVPHHLPQGRGLHYLGFCSGSAGVARMFYELYRVAGDPGDLEWAERLAAGVMASGVPRRRVPGLWDTACQCCGLAGLVELFAGLWAVTARRAYLDFALVLGVELAGRASGDGGGGLRWYQAYRRLRPGEVSADTGYMAGAAGIGAALLHLEAALRAERARRVVLLPDNPFPEIPVPAGMLRE
ncbi:lanthionine synthetase LanC family protein [Nonomuraea sp. SYSU D8015]|uniref:lanthionine synthetase LanC family protein n=1 Tax=Nonomuraea sp. SYSU D8015 TaxID=2593644 RepID=UPI0016613A88|nr:lanthionine synthetase LanC family protein [Nonomuraea sp. SYSU D8015]